MAVQYQGYRKQNPWVVVWRNPWTKSRRTKAFESEEQARAFEQTQKELAQKEKTLLRRSRKRQTSEGKVCVRELIESYFRIVHTNPVTIRQGLYHAAHVLSIFGNRQASKLTLQDILKFSEAQKMRGLTQSTINRRVSILRTAMNWGANNGLIKENPLRDLRMPRAKAQRIAPPTPDEAKAILAAAAPHIQRVILLGLYAGPRIGPSELFRLTWHDVDFTRAILRMPNAKKGSHDEYREIPIRAQLLPMMKAWLRKDMEKGIEFVISYGGRKINSVGQGWRKALRRAGVMRRIRPYDLRHAFATYALVGNADIGAVAQIMGHSDPSMILKTYQHVQDTQRRAAIEANILKIGGNLTRGKCPGL